MDIAFRALTIVVLTLAAVYELAALLNKRKDDTITAHVRDVALKRPLLPFLAGLLAGHFFWSS